ncbi:hypothetical protein [Phytomonospora endophytica]|uniref:Uncharacterized protein n=1 Tax=Phytomonospora endophytica TaxID=714109 RepID=A0A841FX28_9ACTN|nr:hypothetical protein [Phytomonospora endophytica]MBB6037029.1 hypothetical protein [Phytomonospora endophytica]GIG69427.1 hypothetical protein Pen01_57220 [Phytomonospora endophytica]
MTVSAVPRFPTAPSNRLSAAEFRLSLHLTRQRRREHTLRTHRPSRRRLRIARFAGFPIPALIARCQCCGAVWPCRDLISTLRETLGWTRRLNPILARLRREAP